MFLVGEFVGLEGKKFFSYREGDEVEFKG